MAMGRSTIGIIIQQNRPDVKAFWTFSFQGNLRCAECNAFYRKDAKSAKAFWGLILTLTASWLLQPMVQGGRLEVVDHALDTMFHEGDIPVQEEAKAAIA